MMTLDVPEVLNAKITGTRGGAVFHLTCYWAVRGSEGGFPACYSGVLPRPSPRRPGLRAYECYLKKVASLPSKKRDGTTEPDLEPGTCPTEPAAVGVPGHPFCFL